MKFYLFTSGIISKAQMDQFWADVATWAAPEPVVFNPNDVSLGEPNGDEDAFAVYGPRKDWIDKINNDLIETGKPVFVRYLGE